MRVLSFLVMSLRLLIAKNCCVELPLRHTLFHSAACIKDGSFLAAASRCCRILDKFVGMERVGLVAVRHAFLTNEGLSDMTKKDKTMNERAVEAQANKTDVCEELGLTKDEVKIITDYVGLCQKRINQAPVEPISSKAELVVQKKFPNNDEAQSTCTGTVIDDAALKYVEDAAFGYPAGNLEKPAPIEDAKQQMIRASTRLIASPSDRYREISYAKAVKWFAQMQVQQQYKDALSPVLQAVHHIHRGYKWQAPDQTQNATTGDEALNDLINMA
jgi:hypothetical protein